MAVQLVPLEFSTLDDLDDGRISAILKQHIQRVASDCDDRPGDPTVRKIVMEFQIKPLMSDGGDCDEVEVHIEIKSKVPTHRSKRIPMTLSKTGFKFNRDVAEELDGQRLPFNEDDDE